MERITIASLLLLLLGVCNAQHGNDHGTDQESDTEGITDIILRVNNGSNDYLMEGDMYIPNARNALKCYNEKLSCLWPKSKNGKVEVAFTLSDKYEESEKSQIVKAMRDFTTHTCIRFIPRVSQRMYISIEPRYGCFSVVGTTGGKQLLSLQRFACTRQGIIQHELLHALGFHHEHTRNDRDQYIKINWENISENFMYNFDKKEMDYLNTPYDYSSLMHYGRTAFGKRRAVTIVPIPDSSVSIGQSDTMSNTDIVRINRLYKCWNYKRQL